MTPERTLAESLAADISRSRLREGADLIQTAIASAEERGRLAGLEEAKTICSELDGAGLLTGNRIAAAIRERAKETHA